MLRRMRKSLVRRCAVAVVHPEEVDVAAVLLDRLFGGSRLMERRRQRIRKLRDRSSIAVPALPGIQDEVQPVDLACVNEPSTDARRTAVKRIERLSMAEFSVKKALNCGRLAVVTRIGCANLGALSGARGAEVCG